MQFSTAIIQGITSFRRQVAPEPRVDTYRFPPPASFGPYDPNHALAVVDFIASRADLFDQTAAGFADLPSREWLAMLYVFMALGPYHMLLPTNTTAYWAQYDQAARACRGPSGVWFGADELDVFGLEYCGQEIDLICRAGHVAFTFLRRQYMFERGGVRIQPSPGDVVVDAGACLGDTALAFAACVGPAGRVISFDPMPAHAEIVGHNLARNPELRDRVHFIQAALGASAGAMVRFSDSGPASRPSDAGAILAQSTSLDAVVEQQGLDRVDFIKMDIEGGEQAALEGAARTIKRFRPKLAISAYHKADDLLVLPSLIKSLEPSYALYVDHYTVHQEETVLFAAIPA